MVLRDEVERAKRWALNSNDEEAPQPEDFGITDPVAASLWHSNDQLMRQLVEAQRILALADELFYATDTFYEEYRIWEIDTEEWEQWGKPYFDALENYYRARKDVLEFDDEE